MCVWTGSTWKGGVGRVSRARVCRWQRVELEASLEVLVQMGELRQEVS